LNTRKILAFRLIALLAVFAIVVLFPLNDDVAYWQSMSFDWLTYGRWPYIGSWDHNFPGILLVHIPAILLFGPADVGFRLFDVFIQLGFCIVLYRLWRLYLPERVSWIAVLFYAFYYARAAPEIAGQRDIYASLLVLASSYILLRTQAMLNMRTIAVAGLGVGIAVLIRPTYGIYLLPLVLCIPSLRNVRSIVAIGVSSLIPLALSYAIYAMKPGGLDAYWTATVLFNRDLSIGITRPIGNFFRALVSPKLLVVPAGISILWILEKKFARRTAIDRVHLPRRITLLYISFVVLTIALILVQHKYYTYHFAMYGMLLTPLAAIGTERLLRYAPSRIAIPAFFCIFWMLSLPLEMLTRYTVPAAEHGMFSQGLSTALHAAVWEDTSEGRILDYFQHPEHRAGRVEVCSFDARLRLHLMRGPAGIYVSLHPLGFRTDTNDPTAFTPYQRQWRKAYIDSLETIRPSYMVIARATNAEYLKDPYMSVLHGIPGFDSLLETNYKLDSIIGTNDIYKRRSTSNEYR
jgi:hypothetical protein